MKNVVALFAREQDAEKAIKKLAESGFDTGDVRVHNKKTIENSTNIRAMPSANTGVAAGSAPSPAVAGGTTGAPGGAVIADDTVESYLASIGVDGNEVSFFTHGVQEGGSLVLISVSNDEAEKARKVLAEAGGRAPQAE
jgi:hypothetical protein